MAFYDVSCNLTKNRSKARSLRFTKLPSTFQSSVLQVSKICNRGGGTGGYQRQSGGGLSHQKYMTNFFTKNCRISNKLTLNKNFTSKVFTLCLFSVRQTGSKAVQTIQYILPSPVLGYNDHKLPYGENKYPLAFGRGHFLKYPVS